MKSKTQLPTGQELKAKPLMAGTKADGLGKAVFHASDDQHFSVCGLAILGALDPASEIPEKLRCKSKACKAAFRAAKL
jgi:hypothetical protein